MSEEINIYSPPFPRVSASPTQVYYDLTELYDWTLTHLEWANMEASRLGYAEDEFIGNGTLGPYPEENSERFLNLAVPDMYMSWQALRTIREKYDEIVRNYETKDLWQSDAAIFSRINIVKMAAVLLSIAFLDREKREAREQEFMKDVRKKAKKALKRMLEDTKKVEDDDEDTDIDFDALFHPPEDDEN